MTTLQWASENEKQRQFAAAKQALQSALAGSTLLREEEDNVQYHLSYNFLLGEGGMIYAESPQAIARTRQSIVYYAESENSDRYIIKEFTSQYADNNEQQMMREAEIARDVGKAVTKRINDGRYSLMIYRYLGSSLKNYLHENRSRLTELDRIHLALKVCFELFNLHEGVSSNTNTCYAHLDLKTDNLTIDSLENVHLIDFGNSDRLEGVMSDVCGNLLFLLPSHGLLSKPRQQIDLFALLRMLHLPDKFYVMTQRMRIQEVERQAYPDEPTLLTKGMIEQHEILNNLFLRARVDGAQEGQLPSLRELMGTLLQVRQVMMRSNNDVFYQMDPKIKEIEAWYLADQRNRSAHGPGAAASAVGTFSRTAASSNEPVAQIEQGVDVGRDTSNCSCVCC